MTRKNSLTLKFEDKKMFFSENKQLINTIDCKTKTLLTHLNNYLNLQKYHFHHIRNSKFSTSIIDFYILIKPLCYVYQCNKSFKERKRNTF